MKESILIPSLVETDRLIVRDSTMEECTALQQLNEVSDYIAAWVGMKTEPDYIYKCLTEGCLPPGGKNELYQAKSIYIKENRKLIGFSELYHGYPEKEVFFIGWLFIHPDHQHKGYAQEFVNNVVFEASRIGFYAARVGVHLKNWPALRFWSQLGFDKIMGIIGDREHSENTYSVLKLEKNLREM
ncbi:GNAT family N-acetyltransferase [Desulfosporosinus sp. PR]|uniref:GNAT family N-acetyltransferase n=1 Tax=Candidatus Desulfosporosinus nitrosoreducens TaxID=3401928 RepID=UPI0027F136F8|nr:GNAT family N-acetyltransferase [Desulfosporosinus sp. PR]MDQ7094568.1 GNAT family N-acetyltransferase [Desulfosporosinus sp. PR]